MKSAQPPYKRIDAYVSELEEREKKARLRKGVALAVMVIVLGGGFTLFQTFRNSAPEENYPAFSEQLPDDSPTTVAYYPSETDTAEEFEGAQTEKLPLLTVGMTGEKRVGQDLIFEIDNFREDLELTLDFGNGIRRKAKRINRYIYPLAGNFELKLIARQAGRERNMHSLKYQILPATEASVASESYAASTQDFSEIPITRSIAPREPMPQADQADPVVAEEEEVVTRVVDSPPASPMTPQVIADQMPYFPGGSKALDMYLARQVKYPESEAPGRGGQVVVQFVVQPDGELKNFLLLKRMGKGFDEEAVRVISNMPNWIPGRIDAQKVPVYQTLIIPFRP